MKVLKTLIRAISSLSFSKIMTVLGLVITHPLLSILSFYATVRTFTISQKFFPISHSTDGIGNAFRHALWCCMILMYCCKITSPEKALKWCKKITDLHEELFPNEPLQRHMDLHNNKIGMNYFQSLLPGIHRQFFETSFFVDALFEKTKTAIVLESTDQDPADDLVYIKTS